MTFAYTQPGIYNALDTVYGGMEITKSGLHNQAALQNTINAAVTAGGGIVLIPATDGYGHTGLGYKIDCPTGQAAAIIIPDIPEIEMTQPLVICGTGSGTTLRMENSGDVFQINGNPWVTFQDVTVVYLQTSGDPPLTGTAFSFNAGAGSEPPPNTGYRLFRVVVQDCQYPIAFSGNPSLATVRECVLIYTTQYPEQATTGISISGGPIIVDACNMILHEGGTDSGTVGISITNSGGDSVTTNVTVTNTHIEVFQTGVLIGASAGGCNTIALNNLDIAAPNVGIEIQGSGVSDVTVVSCHVQAGAMLGSPNSGILIGSTGDPNSQIDTVLLDGCTVSGFSANGLEIQSGQNIVVKGGCYSGNGSDGGAGIAITGDASNIQLGQVNCLGPIQGGTPQQYGIAITAGEYIQITGANCSGTGSLVSGTSYPGIGIVVENATDIRIIGVLCAGPVFTKASKQQTGISISNSTNVYVQRSTLTGSVTGGSGLLISAAKDIFVSSSDFGANPYALSVMGDSENVYIDGCNFNGSTSAPLNLSSPGTLQIVNSPGYNDQGSILSGLPTSGSTFRPTFFNYYGPIVFYVAKSPESSISLIEVNGVNTHLLSGAFALPAPAPSGSSYSGATASVTYSGFAPPYFLAVGK